MAVAVAAFGFSRLGDDSPRSAPEPTGLGGPVKAPHAASTEAALRSQADALVARDRVAYLAAWEHGDSARQQAELTYSNLVRLGVAHISPRLSLPSVRDRASTWTARVDVTWRLDGLDSEAATTALRYTFVAANGRALITAMAPVPGGREPIWLVAGLEIRRGPRTLVAAGTQHTATRIEGLLREAVTAVDKVLPAWRGDLVAYAPSSVREFAALIGATPSQYRGIAAVSTVVDGSHERTAPTAIVVNPRVFDGLGPVGARVVITHEATHAATHAAAVSMPLWVAEGFADYVGIGSVHLPVAVAAKAALNAVRRTGPPAMLPRDDDFAVGGAGLEATYEQAWLATSLIAHTYGRAKLVAFYRAVESRPDEVDGAFDRTLNTSLAAFTASWQRYLQETAGAR